MTDTGAAVAALEAEIAKTELELKRAFAAGNAPLAAACERIIEKLTTWKVEHQGL